MKIEDFYPKEFTRDYLKSRNNITLVIRYLNELKDGKASIEVNNDSVRLLMEALKIQSELYIDLNKLPSQNTELQLRNHVLQVENKKLQKDLDEALRMKI